jgi:hypothetical protein
MSHDCAVPADGSRTWASPEGMHVDVRGLSEAECRDHIAAGLDSREGGGTLVAHFDEEPIALYPEFDELGWTHELVPMCGHHDRQDGVMLRLVRLQPAGIRK